MRSLLLVSIVAALGAAQEARPAGVVRGRVVTASGRPVRRASVRVTPSAGGFPMTATSDSDGRYEISGVAAGDYRITAGKAGSTVGEFGRRRAFERGVVVSVRAGESVDRVDITLPAGGAIAGRVVDANGDPVEGVDVGLMQPRFAANAKRLFAVPEVKRRTTNDQGRYRLYGVPPGQYMVVANPASPQPAALLPAGYAATYAPATTNASDARAIAVGDADEIDDVDVVLARGAAARISGTVVDARGKAVAARILVSRSLRSGALTAEPSMVPSGSDGRFEIKNVAPGEWVLQASTGADVNKGEEGEFAAQFVTVAGADVDDVRLQTSIGSRVTGRIVFDGASAPAPTGVTVTSMPADMDLATMVGPVGRAAAKADGTFALAGLNGPRRIEVRAPPPWSLEAIRAGGRDITDEAQPFGTAEQSLADIEIVLTSAAARVAGTVVDERGRPQTDYTVIVFAVRPERWYQGSRFLAFTRPAIDGSFVVAGLPPAEYYVAAVDRLESADGHGEWQDPAVLESIAPRATRLVLGDAQAATVTLRRAVR